MHCCCAGLWTLGDRRRAQAPKTFRLADAGTYQISLDNSNGQRLGLELDASDGKTLFVTSIVGGLVQQWNELNEDRRVGEGDCILAVDSVSGDSPRLAQALQRKCVMSLTLCSGSAGASQSSSSGAKVSPRVCEIHVDTSQRQRLGLEMETSNDNELIVKSIMGGVIQQWNSEQQDERSVHIGDAIVAVDSVAAHPEELLRRLQNGPTSIRICSSGDPFLFAPVSEPVQPDSPGPVGNHDTMQDDILVPMELPVGGLPQASDLLSAMPTFAITEPVKDGSHTDNPAAVAQDNNDVTASQFIQDPVCRVISSKDAENELPLSSSSKAEASRGGVSEVTQDTGVLHNGLDSTALPDKCIHIVADVDASLPTKLEICKGDGAVYGEHATMCAQVDVRHVVAKRSLGDEQAEDTPDSQLCVWTETPGNPRLSVAQDAPLEPKESVDPRQDSDESGTSNDSTVVADSDGNRPLAPPSRTMPGKFGGAPHYSSASSAPPPPLVPDEIPPKMIHPEVSNLVKPEMQEDNRSNGAADRMFETPLKDIPEFQGRMSSAKNRLGEASFDSRDGFSPPRQWPIRMQHRSNLGEAIAGDSLAYQAQLESQGDNLVYQAQLEPQVSNPPTRERTAASTGSGSRMQQPCWFFGLQSYCNPCLGPVEHLNVDASAPTVYSRPHAHSRPNEH